MASEAQIQANRLNAQKSTGPRTVEGKAVVAQNAVRHGLLAQQAVIGGEDLGEFEFYRDQMLAELSPAGAALSSFVQSKANFSNHKIAISNSLKNGYRGMARFVGVEAKPIRPCGAGPGIPAAALYSFVQNKANCRRFWANNEGRARKQSQSKPIGQTGGGRPEAGGNWHGGHLTRHERRVTGDGARQTKPISRFLG